MPKKYADFNVSLKLILKKNGKVLILTERHTEETHKAGCVDLPGGRIEKNEENLPLKDLFKREVREELGQVKYKVLGPAIQYRRVNSVTKKRALITAYEAEYLSGKIKLSSEHSKYEWVDPKIFDFRGREFNNPEERKAFFDYFKKFK